MLDHRDRDAAAAVQEARRLFGAGPAARELEVVYGHAPKKAGQVAILTRSVLHILHELGAGIEVPEADLARGDTPATRAPDPNAPDAPKDVPRRPLIVVRQGRAAPADAFAAVPYRDRWFWIDTGDYRSKAAFTFAYVLQTLAESSHTQAAPVVTIPSQ